MFYFIESQTKMRKIGNMPIFRKKEIERTRKEKIIRDCVFFALLIFICRMCIKTINMMYETTELLQQAANVNYLMPWVSVLTPIN